MSSLLMKTGSIMYVSMYNYSLRYKEKSVFVDKSVVVGQRMLKEFDIVEFDAVPITKIQAMQLNEGVYEYQYIAKRVKFIRAARIIIGEGIFEQRHNPAPSAVIGYITYRTAAATNLKLAFTQKVLRPVVEVYNQVITHGKAIRFAAVDFEEDRKLKYRVILATNTNYTIKTVPKMLGMPAVKYVVMKNDDQIDHEKKEYETRTQEARRSTSQNMDEEHVVVRKDHQKGISQAGTRKAGISTNQNMDEEKVNDRKDHQKESSKPSEQRKWLDLDDNAAWPKLNGETSSIASVNPTPMAVVQNGRAQEGVHETGTPEKRISTIDEENVADRKNHQKETSKKEVKLQSDNWAECEVFPLLLDEGNWDAIHWLKEKYIGKNN